MGEDGDRSAAGAAVAWIGWWMASAALWLALVDNTHAPELIVGAGVAVLAASGAVVVRRQRPVVPRGRVAGLLRLWRPLAFYAADLWKLVRALPARRVGRFVAIPLGRGDDDDPRAAGRRVLSQTAGSFAPNTYVIGPDHERDLLLVHQLVPSDDPASDADPLRLR